MAASLAEKLKAELNVEAGMVRGGFGEFTVQIDDQKVVKTNRFWYPTLSTVLVEVKAYLAGKER